MASFPERGMTVNDKTKTSPEIVSLTARHPLPDGELRLLGSVDSVMPTLTMV